MLFDQTMAQGLRRPCDWGRAVAESFVPGAGSQPGIFSGAPALTDVQLAALG
jgi:hypothetical protein